VLVSLLLLAMSSVVARAERRDNLPVGTVTNFVDLYAVDHATFLSAGSKVLVRSWQASYLFDMASRRLVRNLVYETYADASMLSPDEQWMISGHRDGKIRLWNLATGAPAISLEGKPADGEPEEISALTASADGSLLVAGGKLGTISIWNLKTRQRSRSFGFGEMPGGRNPHIIALRLTADRQGLIAVTAISVRIFDLQTGRRLAAFDLPSGQRNYNNSFFESSIVGDDEFVARYSTPDCEIGELRYFSLKNPDDTVLIDKPANCRKPEDMGDPTLFANPARSTILVARWGSAEVKEWDLKSRSVVRTITWPNDAKLQLIGVDKDFSKVADSGEHAVSIRELENGTSRGEVEELSYPADGAALSADGRSILLAQQVAGKDKQQLTFWEVGAPDPRKVQLIAADSETTIRAFSLQAKLVAAVAKGDFVLSSTETGSELRRLSVKEIKEPSQIRLSPDGRQALLLGADANDEEIAFLVDTADGTVKGQLGRRDKSKAASDRDDADLTEAAFSPDGRRLALGRFDGTAEIWDTKTLKRIKLLPMARGDTADQIRVLAFSADGKRLVAGSRDSGVFLWNIEAGGPPRAFQYDTLAGHVHFTSVAISHDGSLVIGALSQHALSSGDTGPERSIRVWNAATGKLRFTLRGHDAAIARVTFSPDDRWIVSVGHDGTIRYWSTETGKCAATIIVTNDGHWVALSESGIFSGNPGETNLFNLARGFEARPGSDFRGQLDRPELIDALLKGDKDHRYAAAARVLDLKKLWEGAGR
jgi:WD40 repeat protein